MKLNRSEVEIDAGKLISAIQKEWGYETGEPESEWSEQVMSKGHNLLQAAKNNNITVVLNGLSITQFLGDIWVHKHKRVKESILKLENSIKDLGNA